MPLSRALASPPASALLEMTRTISAGKSCALAASTSAVMFDPRPDIRMATRRFMASPFKIEMAVIEHAMLARGGNDLAQQHGAFARLGEDIHDPIDGTLFDDGNHADAAVEGAQQFKLRNPALPGEPFEHRQHRYPRKIDAGAKMLWQHAGNVVGKA